MDRTQAMNLIELPAADAGGVGYDRQRGLVYIMEREVAADHQFVTLRPSSKRHQFIQLIMQLPHTIGRLIGDEMRVLKDNAGGQAGRLKFRIACINELDQLLFGRRILNLGVGDLGDVVRIPESEPLADAGFHQGVKFLLGRFDFCQVAGNIIAIDHAAFRRHARLSGANVQLRGLIF